jgi:hypothetical protein
MGVGRDVEDSGGYVDWSIAERAHYRYITNNQQRRDCKIDLRRHVSEFHVGAAFFSSCAQAAEQQQECWNERPKKRACRIQKDKSLRLWRPHTTRIDLSAGRLPDAGTDSGRRTPASVTLVAEASKRDSSARPCIHAGKTEAERCQCSTVP